jgi:hypothetical protein
VRLRSLDNFLELGDVPDEVLTVSTGELGVSDCDHVIVNEEVNIGRGHRFRRQRWTTLQWMYDTRSGATDLIVLAFALPPWGLHYLPNHLARLVLERHEVSAELSLSHFHV